jgi:hypothetical protein
MSLDLRKFLIKIAAPVVILGEEPLFQDEAVPKGYVDDLVDERGLPSGGQTGQVLAKSSNSDYETTWVNSDFNTMESLNTHANNTAIHFQIDDAAMSTSSVWSSTKVSIEVSMKSDYLHTHGNISSSGFMSTINAPLITSSTGYIQAGSFGTSALTFCQGNDSRLSDSRIPLAHSHGAINSNGYMSSVNTPLITSSTGCIQAGSFGSSALTFCQGNDSRLSNSRTPLPHFHYSTDIYDSTVAGRNLISAATIIDQRTYLGLGSAALTGSSDYATATQGVKADAAYSMLTNIEAALNVINGT